MWVYQMEDAKQVKLMIALRLNLMQEGLTQIEIQTAMEIALFSKLSDVLTVEALGGFYEEVKREVIA